MLNNFRSRLKKLPPSARRYLLVAFLGMLLLALPIMVWGLVTGRFELRKRAASGEPILNPINIYTDNVSIHADDHYIIANGQKYTINQNTLRVHAEAGDSINNYQLFLKWQESNKEIGIKLYFTSDQNSWTVSKIDSTIGDIDASLGIVQSFYGPFPRQAIDQPYLANIDYSGTLPFELNGTLHFSNLYVLPNFIGEFALSCNLEDQGIINVDYYKRSDGYTGLKITAKASTLYANTAISIAQSGYDEGFISSLPVILGEAPGPYSWTWDTVKPVSDDFTIRFYINRTPNKNGEECGSLQSKQLLQFKLKFTGVTSRPIDDSAKQIRVYGTSDNGGSIIGSPNGKSNIISVGLTVDDSGVYHGYIEPSGGSYYGYNYRLRIKGQKHLQEVFNNVVFERGVETDLTAKPLRPGDINQDGTLDKTDLIEVSKRIFSNKIEDISLVDVNYDKRVDIIDRTLILNTLSVQSDQE